MSGGPSFARMLPEPAGDLRPFGRRAQMTEPRSVHLFILGTDYHLGDLLWFTAVLGDFRTKAEPARVIVSLPDRPVSRILECNPLIDELVYGEPGPARGGAQRRFGSSLAIHDLRPVPIGVTMVRQWRRRLPWLYYRDLWLQPRGQWLATFLGLGAMRQFRPTIRLTDEDRVVAGDLPSHYVVLAPHIGAYSLPFAGRFWYRMKGWPSERWAVLAERLRHEGFEPLTLGAEGQHAVPGTRGLIGLPIRQVAGVVERASALVTVESGLWYVAAALDTPFVIVRWWLPRSVDWPGPTRVPHARMYRGQDSVTDVLGCLNGLIGHEPA